MKRPLASDDELWLCNTASSIEALFPKSHLPERINLNYIEWSRESFFLAVNVAYKGLKVNDPPSPEYFAQGELTAMCQIALAGYRLAGLINELFND